MVGVEYGFVLVGKVVRLVVHGLPREVQGGSMNDAFSNEMADLEICRQQLLHLLVLLHNTTPPHIHTRTIHSASTQMHPGLHAFCVRLLIATRYTLLATHPILARSRSYHIWIDTASEHARLIPYLYYLPISPGQNPFAFPADPSSKSI